MPVADLELVLRVRDAWCRLVPDEITSFYSSDVELVSPQGEMFGRVYRGHDGLRRYIGDLAEVWEPPTFELEELFDARNRVVEVVHASTRGRQSGVEVGRRIPSVYTVRDGLIAKHVIYLDPADAVNAVAPNVKDADAGGTSEFSIRRARPPDAATLATTLAEAFDSYRVWAPTGWSPPDHTAEATDALALALSRADVWCLVARCDGNPAGHVALAPRTAVQPEDAPTGTVNLWQMFVRQAWHGRGIASLLMLSAIAEARRRGYTRIRLWTPRDAARARRFYEREGFTLTGNEREESPLGIAIVEYAHALSAPDCHTRPVSRAPSP